MNARIRFALILLATLPAPLGLACNQPYAAPDRRLAANQPRPEHDVLPPTWLPNGRRNPDAPPPI